MLRPMPALVHKETASRKDAFGFDGTLMRRDPELVIASWCGKKVNVERIRQRPGWDRVSAVRAGRIHEIKSTYILQPGPASLTEGARQLHALVAAGTAAPGPRE